MAPHSNAEIYAAAKEISTSLTHLKREQSATKSTVSTLFDQIVIQQRHLNRIDDLIDEHQSKIDGLMHLVVDMEQTQDQAMQEDARSSSIAIDQSFPVSGWEPFENSTDQPDAEPNAEDGVILSMSPQNGEASAMNAIVKLEATEQPVNSTFMDALMAADQNQGLLDNQAAMSSAAAVGNTVTQQQRRFSRRSSIRSKTQLKRMKGQQSRRSSSNRSKSITLIKSPDSAPSTAYSLESARRVNDDGKITYNCCDYSFADSYQYRRHVMFKHTMERPFKCALCEYATVTKYALQRHHDKHHTEGKS